MSRMPQIPAVHEAASAVAEDLEKTGVAIGESQVAQHRSKGVPGWVGASADAYTDSIVRLGSYARNFAHAFVEPSKRLSAWAEEVKTTRKKIDDLHERQEEAVLEYEKAIYALREWVAVQERLGVQVTPEVIQPSIAMIENKYQATLDGLFREYDSLIATLTETAGVAAKALHSSMDSLVPPGKRSSRCEIGANLFDGIDVVDGQAEQERAQEIAPAIAHRMQDRDFTPEDLEEFHKKYGEELSNPFVARALAEHIGPQEMSEFAVRVAAAGANPAKSEVRDDVLKQLGTSMVLASGGSNYNGKDAEYQRKFEAVRDGLRTGRGDSMAKHASEYASRLKIAGRSPIKVDAIASAPQHKEVEGYSIISQLLGKAGESNPDLALGAEFFERRDDLTSVAQDMVAWDAEQGNSTWRTHYRFDNIPSLFGGNDRQVIDPIHSMATLMDQPDALNSEGGIPKSFAPGVEEEELRRKDAVKSFLAGDTPQGMDVDGDGNADEPMNMTRYLTGGRLGLDYYGFQDGGEQFGKVIAEASAVEEYPGGALSSEAKRDWMLRDEQAARIAANFMFGYQDGLDAETNPLDEGQDPFGKNNKALRSWAGLILGPHLEGFASSLDQNTQSNDVRLSTDAKRHWITTSGEMRERLLGKNGFFIDLGFDKPEVHDNNTPGDPTDDYYLGKNGKAGRAPALANLILQAGAEYGRDVHDIISGRSEESLAQVGGRWAPLLDALFTAPSGASEQAIEEMNKRNKMWRSLFNKAMDSVPSGDLAKAAAPGAMKLATYAVDQVKGMGAVALDSLFPIAEKGKVDLVRESEMVQTYMHNAVYDSLSAQERLYDLPTTPAGYNSEIRVDEERFIDKAGRVIPYSAMTPKQRDHFKSYIAQHLPKFGAGDGLQDIETAANNARKANENARIRSEDED